MVVLACLAASPLRGQQPAPCTDDPEHAAFDFWLGEWDVFVGDGQRAGTNRIEKAERGCLVIEHWTGAGGGTGTSMNFYDPARGLWRQVWVSSNGVLIEIEGGIRDGSMVLQGTLTDVAGEQTPFRGTWTPLDDGAVRQHFEISEAGDGTWSTWFDGRYVRR